MSGTKEKNRVTRAISLTEEEDERIRSRAEAAGMSITAYMRQQALRGTVVSIDWDTLRSHMDIITWLVMELKLYLSDISACERRMFDVELTRIANELEDIRGIEEHLPEFIYKICAEEGGEYGCCCIHDLQG